MRWSWGRNGRYGRGCRKAMKTMVQCLEVAGQVPELLFKNSGVVFVAAVDQEDIHQHREAE